MGTRKETGVADHKRAGDEAQPPASTEAAKAIVPNVAEPVSPSNQPADPLAGLTDMPAVQAHAIDAASGTATAAPTDAVKPPDALPGSGTAAPTDKFGRGFNASWHETEPDGSPRVSATGKLHVRRGRGAAGALERMNAAPPVSPVQSIVGADPAGAPNAASFDPAKIDQCAKTMTALFFSAGCMVFGDDGQPIIDKAQNIDEPQEIYQSFHTYYSIKGAKDIPPGVILCVALISYGRRRVTLPAVKSRFVRLKEKMTLWFVKLRFRRKEEPRANDTSEPATEEKEAA